MIQNIGSFVLLSWLWANREKEAIQPEVVEVDEILQKFNDQEEIIKNNPPSCRYGFNAVLIKGSYPVPSSWYCEKSKGIGF